MLVSVLALRRQGCPLDRMPRDQAKVYTLSLGTVFESFIGFTKKVAK